MGMARQRVHSPRAARSHVTSPIQGSSPFSNRTAKWSSPLFIRTISMDGMRGTDTSVRVEVF